MAKNVFSYNYNYLAPQCYCNCNRSYNYNYSPSLIERDIERVVKPPDNQQLRPLFHFTISLLTKIH